MLAQLIIVVASVAFVLRCPQLLFRTATTGRHAAFGAMLKPYLSSGVRPSVSTGRALLLRQKIKAESVPCRHRGQPPKIGQDQVTKGDQKLQIGAVGDRHQQHPISQRQPPPPPSPGLLTTPSRRHAHSLSNWRTSKPVNPGTHSGC